MGERTTEPISWSCLSVLPKRRVFPRNKYLSESYLTTISWNMPFFKHTQKGQTGGFIFYCSDSEARVGGIWGRFIGMEPHSSLGKLENKPHHGNCWNHNVVELIAPLTACHVKADVYEFFLKGMLGKRFYGGFIATGQALHLLSEVKWITCPVSSVVGRVVIRVTTDLPTMGRYARKPKFRYLNHEFIRK